MRQRVDKLRELLKKNRLDAILISSLTNIRYLFGFTGSNALGLVTFEGLFFLTDRRYINQADHEVPDAEIRIAEKDLLSEVASITSVDAVDRLGVESAYLTLKEYSQLKIVVPDAQIVACERLVEKITSIKTEAEIESVSQAAQICRRTLEEVIPQLRAGLAEQEISAELSYRSRKHGSERDPFEPIVASGRRSALPHGISSAKRLEAGDLIVIDFGSVVNGYAADVTRTFVLGEVTPKQKEISCAVVAALENSERAAKAGIVAKDLDQVARSFFAEKGMAEYFQHSLGHGLGLDVHEIPRIGERSKDVLASGNIITLEPGLYMPDIGGVRVEDDFAVTPNGVENLFDYPREVVSVG